MSEIQEIVIVDVMSIAPAERRSKIFKAFDALSPGQELHVIVDHDPGHLLEHMRHEGLPVDYDAYKSLVDGKGMYTGIFKKREVPVQQKVKFTSLDKERAYSATGFNPVEVHTGENYKIIITYIKAGQFIPVHSPDTDLVFAVFKGSGYAVAGDSEVKIMPGDILIIPGGESRGIKASTDMEALHMVFPIPTVEDHEEVMRKLASNSFY